MVCLFPLFVLAALSCCSRAQEEVSEKALYSSDTWQSSTRAVLVREQGEEASTARRNSPGPVDTHSYMYSPITTCS